MLPRKRFLTLVLTLAALFAFLIFTPNFVEAQEKVSIVTADLQPLSADTVRVNIVFVNRLPTAEGKVTLSFSGKLSLVTEGRNWTCSAKGKVCSLPVRVLGQEKIPFDFRLKEYFDLDYLDVFFAVGNESVGTRIMLSHIQEPGAITPAALFYIGLVSLVIGAVAWMLVLWALTLKKAEQFKFLAALVRRYILLFSILANLFAALGLALLISPGISIASVVVFSAAFAGGFLVLLNYIPTKAAAPTMSKEEIAAEKRRLQDMVTEAKVRLMKREIDDATYNRIVQECELQLVKLSALEKELS